MVAWDEEPQNVEQLVGLVALERVAPQRRARTPEVFSARSPTRVPLYPYSKDAPCMAFSQRHSVTVESQQPDNKSRLQPTRCSSARADRCGRIYSNQPQSRPQRCIERLKSRPAWAERHHVVESKDNSSNNIRRRMYFDNLPLAHCQITHAEALLEEPRTYQPALPDDGQKNDASRSVDKPRRSRVSTVAKVKALDDQAMKLYRATAAVPGLEICAEFYLWCSSTYKNLTRVWQALDTNLDMSLGYLEFMTALKKTTYDGDGKKLFKILDRDGTGLLAYYHFDPHGASELASVLNWCEDCFGNVGSAFDVLDKDKSGFLSIDEFVEGARKFGFANEFISTHLFHLLDQNGDRKVRKEEWLFLDRWKCPAYLKSPADPGAALIFKRRLLEKHRNNAIVAWYAALDKDHSMRVSWEEFKAAAKRDRRTSRKDSGNLGMSQISERKLASIWRVFDKNMSGWLSLREFDAPSFTLLLRFKEYYTEQYGSLQAAIRHLDSGSMNGQLSRKEFVQIQQDLGLSDEDTDHLFDGLDVDGEGQISGTELKYLDAWDHVADHREEQFWSIISSELMELQVYKVKEKKEHDEATSSTSPASALKRTEGHEKDSKRPATRFVDKKRNPMFEDKDEDEDEPAPISKNDSGRPVTKQDSARRSSRFDQKKARRMTIRVSKEAQDQLARN